MKGFAGGSAGAGWEDKHLSPFLGKFMALYTLSRQVFKARS